MNSTMLYKADDLISDMTTTVVMDNNAHVNHLDMECKTATVQLATSAQFELQQSTPQLYQLVLVLVIITMC